MLAAQRSGLVIKTAVSGGLGVIGIVNVESSWGRLREGVCLCVKHTQTLLLHLDLIQAGYSEEEGGGRKEGTKANKSPESLRELPGFFSSVNFYF